ncbi:hypothetical protein [Archangium lipolyticum]|uniref:hypothetical protein n=1 Tax=Archangium lipolyticum TaxID=2970465 RepID=UPI00214A1694|nr:hypothetical protein [Archangium lipolyticum]
MSRRMLRRTLARLLLAAPTLPLLGCNLYESSCGPAGEGSGQPSKGNQTFRIAEIQLADGGTPAPGASCEELCVAVAPQDNPPGPCSLQNGDGGTPEMVTCTVTFLCEGRRPEGLLSDGSVDGRVSALGALFASMAHLEAASVPAFERLARELEAQGAPARLVRAARRAAADEVRHARAMGTLAERHGAPVPAVEVEPFQPRSLERLALENAVEGCVRETFGALLAGWQARCAGDARVRQSLAHIAPDELRHAELSWEIDAWVLSRLDEAARRRIHEARREALRTLQREVEESVEQEELVRLAGLPSREDARKLVQGLSEWVISAEA